MPSTPLTGLIAFFQFLTIEAALAATGSYQILDGVVHVTFDPPVQQLNGGLTVGDIYDLEGTESNGNQIIFTDQEFQGFNQSGAARFAAHPAEGIAIQIGRKGVVQRKIREPHS
jgi:hypothetical protein